MWCWRRMEKISWKDHVKNSETLQSIANIYTPTPSHFIFYELLSNAASISEHVASNLNDNTLVMNWKIYGRQHSWAN